MRAQFPAVAAAMSKGYYEIVTGSLSQQFQESSLMRSMHIALPTLRDEYRAKHSADLFMADGDALKVLSKPFDSFLLKTYRRNVLNNSNWPGEPTGGWIEPSSWFSAVKDILRCQITARYMDGAIFLAEGLSKRFAADARLVSLDYEARESGYYAVHLVTDEDLRVPSTTMQYLPTKVRFEIQITTQLQEVMRSLTHHYYEKRRQAPEGEKRAWQWDYKSEEFTASYLAHMLHYIEGAIMEIRDKRAS